MFLHSRQQRNGAFCRGVPADWGGFPRKVPLEIMEAPQTGGFWRRAAAPAKVLTDMCQWAQFLWMEVKPAPTWKLGTPSNALLGMTWSNGRKQVFLACSRRWPATRPFRNITLKKTPKNKTSGVDFQPCQCFWLVCIQTTSSLPYWHKCIHRRINHCEKTNAFSATLDDQLPDTIAEGRSPEFLQRLQDQWPPHLSHYRSVLFKTLGHDNAHLLSHQSTLSIALPIMSINSANYAVVSKKTTWHCYTILNITNKISN